jgi:hypothetical protein
MTRRHRNCRPRSRAGKGRSAGRQSRPSSMPVSTPSEACRQAAVYRREGGRRYSLARVPSARQTGPKAIARRRRLAASGPKPPRLATHFTVGELAVLRVMADEARDKGMCDRTYVEMAARAGVCRRTARNAVRRAKQLGLVNVEERSRPGRKHLANLITLISKEWRMWLERRPARRRERMAAPMSERPDSGPGHSSWIDRGQIFAHHGRKDSTRGFQR